MRSAAKTAQIEDEQKILLEAVGLEGWDKDWSRTMTNERETWSATANLISINQLILLAFHCRASGFSAAISIRFITDLALFSMMRHVSRETQRCFWRSHQEYKAIRIFMLEKFEGIYDSPYKLTFA